MLLRPLSNIHDWLSTTLVGAGDYHELLDEITDWQIWNRKMLGKSILPWCPTRRITQDVGFASDPDLHEIEPLQVQGPIRQLLAPAPIVQLRAAEQVIVVACTATSD